MITPLAAGATFSLDMLRYYGSDLNAVDNSGSTPLHRWERGRQQPVTFSAAGRCGQISPSPHGCSSSGAQTVTQLCVARYASRCDVWITIPARPAGRRGELDAHRRSAVRHGRHAAAHPGLFGKRTVSTSHPSGSTAPCRHTTAKRRRCEYITRMTKSSEVRLSYFGYCPHPTPRAYRLRR
jgi:hypothetical protein